MDTCLFTDSPLTENTKIEHTIPAKIGGRIRSTRVASDGFNARCGSSVDRELIGTYWQLMMTLGPLLAIEHQAGERRIQISGSSGHHVVDGKAVVHRKGSEIIDRDPKTNRPTAAAAQNLETIMHILRPNMPASAKIEQSYFPHDYGYADLPVCQLLSAEIEVAVLKSAMLTFDHLLIEHPNRFTRSPVLAPLRNSIKEIIMGGADDSAFLRRVSLGVQYEKIDEYRKLRNEGGFSSTDFEHVLIVSANLPTRTLDLVFWVFGLEPYGFRLCDDWSDGAFTYLVINGVLHGTHPSGLLPLAAKSQII